MCVGIGVLDVAVSVCELDTCVIVGVGSIVVGELDMCIPVGVLDVFVAIGVLYMGVAVGVLHVCCCRCMFL